MGGEVAFEFDVKFFNGGNIDVSEEVQGLLPDIPFVDAPKLGGACLEMERNNFWIDDRDSTHFKHDLPEGTGIYWDTDAFDSCEIKDTTWGIFHPEELVKGVTYSVDIVFDGSSAAGQQVDTPFYWSTQLLRRNCDVDPWCVNVEEQGGEGFQILQPEEERFPRFFEPDKEPNPAPAEMPGCWEYWSMFGPEIPGPERHGPHACIFPV